MSSPVAGRRIRMVLSICSVVVTVALYAEGVLKNGWVSIPLLLPAGLLGTQSRWRPYLTDIVLSFLAVSLAVVALDMALRPIMGSTLHFSPANMLARKLPELPLLGRWDANAHIEMDSYGDLAAIAGRPDWREPRSVAFQTDSRGFRNASEPGAVDLVILGDSFSAGIGTTQRETFAHLLARDYGRHVYNMSYPGGPWDEYVTFMLEAPRLPLSRHPLLLWTLYTGNDLDDSGGEEWDINRLPRNGPLGRLLVRLRTYRNRSPLHQWYEAMRARSRHDGSEVLARPSPDGRPILFHRKHERWSDRSKDDIEVTPNFIKLKRTLGAMHDAAGARHMQLVVLLFPTKGDVYRWVLAERPHASTDDRSSGFAHAVLSACHAVRVDCLDSKRFLVAEARRRWDARGELLWWRDDTHMGPQGHAAVARFIDEEILRGKPSGHASGEL